MSAALRGNIGRIERRPLREVWPHEAHSFTRWLVDNIDVVGEAIGIDLVSAEREQAAGAFSLDILAEDAEGQRVIVENQLGASDHDHLGKVLTYLTAFEAQTAVWIVGQPRPEHVRAIAWLNEASSGAFYLLKLEAVQIGESSPAPLLTLIVGPAEESRQVGTVKRELAQRHLLRNEYWTQLLQYAASRTALHKHVSPAFSTWVSLRLRNGLSLNYNVRQHSSAVELYIDRGKGSEEENVEILHQLEASKNDIENAFGGPLDWDALDGRRACRISKRLELGGYQDREAWPEVFEATVDAMIRFEEALRPQLERLGLLD